MKYSDVVSQIYTLETYMILLTYVTSVNLIKKEINEQYLNTKNGAKLPFIKKLGKY